MSGLTATLADLLGALNQSFRLSAFFPSLIFTLANVLLAQQYLNETTLYKMASGSEAAIVLTIFTLALGVSYAISILNVPITQLYEGYAFRQTGLGYRLTENSIRRMQWINREIARLEQAADDSKKKFQNRQNEIELPYWQDTEYRTAYRDYLKASVNQIALFNEFIKYYPPEEELVLPTRLGNVYSSFETHSKNRYGIDGIALWPRLLPSLLVDPAKYAGVVERQKMGFDFFLNLSFLSLLLALEYCAISLYFSAYLAIVVPLVALALTWIFYRFAIMAALSFGTTVKVAFDLYRNTLRQSLGVVPPRHFDEEKEMWRQISDFLVQNDKSNLGADLFYRKSDSATK